ncbi:hypothetical protein JTB14_005734 [Gonioctena quinquepunctata]|nr:hypothetical protein JTB14_005734 [Gonioctena quinquepunctata]
MAQGYHNLEVTAGAFWKPLSLTVTYEATIPLIYKANWHDDTLVERTRSENQCSYEDNHTSRECSLIRDINALQMSYMEEFAALTSSWIPDLLENLSTSDGHQMGKRALDFLGDGLSWCCGVVIQHTLDSLVMGSRNICLHYADLIRQAITTSPNQKLTLSQIFDWLLENVPIFGNRSETSASWKNSVRHNLSLHSKFVRIQNGGTEKGRRNICGIYSYADLIRQTITTSNQKLTPFQIYDWMLENVPIFKNRSENSASRKNSVRHNLSLHSKLVRTQNGGTGKGSWWALDPEAKQTKLVELSTFTGRRRSTTIESGKMEAKRLRAKRIVHVTPKTHLSPIHHQPRKFGHLPNPTYGIPNDELSLQTKGILQLSPIPSEEVCSSWVNSTPETMDTRFQTSPCPAYHLNPAFRPIAYSSGSSSCGKLSPRRCEELHLVNLADPMEYQAPQFHPYQLSPVVRPRLQWFFTGVCRVK